MGKTYKDQNRYDQKKKFPRVPPITKRSEPFEDKRRKGEKHKKEWKEETAEIEMFEEPSEEEKQEWDSFRYGPDDWD